MIKKIKFRKNKGSGEVNFQNNTLTATFLNPIVKLFSSLKHLNTAKININHILTSERSFFNVYIF